MGALSSKKAKRKRRIAASSSEDAAAAAATATATVDAAGATAGGQYQIEYMNIIISMIHKLYKVFCLYVTVKKMLNECANLHR